MTTPPYHIPVSGAEMASMNAMNNNSQYANNNNNNNNNNGGSLQIKNDYDLTTL